MEESRAQQVVPAAGADAVVALLLLLLEFLVLGLVLGASFFAHDGAYCRSAWGMMVQYIRNVLGLGFPCFCR